MKTTIIKVVVKLTIASSEKLTENEKEQIVADMEYSFDFAEILNGEFVGIIDTEITDIVMPGTNG